MSPKDDAALTRVGQRYGRVAAFYDRAIGERLLYHSARARTVELLGLSPGATVVDVACGTGLNFELLEKAIGPSGTLVGVDITAGMLAQARLRAQRCGWSNVKLVELDAADLSLERLERAGALPAGISADAAICTLGLTVIPRWEAAWEAMLGLVRPGGAVAVMDGDYPPHPGANEELVALRPFAWLIYRLTVADRTRRPWRRVEQDLVEPRTAQFSSGYVRVAAGRTPGGLAGSQKPPPGG